MESSPRHIREVSEGTDQPQDTGGPTPPSPDPGPFLSALREAAEHESHKEELIEGKTRGIVTIAGAYFAIVQTVAFSASDTVGQLQGSGLDWTVGLAMSAIVMLALAIGSAVKQQWPKEHRSLPSEKIGQDLLDLLYGGHDSREALHQLAKRYAGVTASRETANDQRVEQYYTAAAFSLLAVAMTTAELIVALVARI